MIHVKLYPKRSQRGMNMTLFVLSFLLTASSLFSKTPLLRLPDVSGNTVVFVAGEDIWKAPLSGGTAVRLTFNDGQEAFPKFSPDGKLIAFTGEYDGNADVYVMDANGGNITRVTYHPGYDRVVGWNPVNNKILFSSGRNSTTRYTKLFMISPDGTGLDEMIMYDASQGSFSPDGTKIAYNKVYRENRTWKRYKGGLAQEVYIYDLTNNQEQNITQFRGTDRIPMWIGNKIYFSSDRDGVLNIYAYNTGTEAIEQVTHHTDYDIRRPSNDKDKIVYELGGDIWVLDIKTNQTKKVPIEILADMEEMRPYHKDVSKDIKSIGISPTGERALIVARGEVFTVPRKDGPTRNLTNSSGARDRGAVWSPDGKHIAYISDKSGEYQVYVTDPKGEGEAIKLTDYKDGYRHTLRWSPDSKMLAFTDQTLTLYLLDVSTMAVTKVDKAEYENVDVSINLKPISDFSWSPDSRYIVYSRMNKDFMYQLYVYSLDNKDIHGISNGLYHDFDPVFTNDGQHILFVSNRRYDPTYGDMEWQMVYKDIAGIYAITLKKYGASLMEFNSNEENKEEPAVITTTGAENVQIDFDGITDRVEALPLKRGNYRHLSVNDHNLFYLNAEKGDFNKFEFRGVKSMSLYSYSFNDEKEKELVADINDYSLSFDGSALVYKKGDKVAILPSSGNLSEEAVLDLSGLKMWFDPVAEWHQIYNEAWRMERDYYYEPGMNGLNWKAIKEKYQPMIDRASCRQDVRFVIGELIGELNTSHTYIFGGDTKREADRVNIGMLGTDWQMDAKNKKYKFGKIYREKDWARSVYPPLAKPGVDLNEGDYLLQVNGNEVTTDQNIYSYFQDLAGKQVTLTVNGSASLKGARQVTVEPVRSESDIRYMDWLEANRKAVDEASNGKIGYIYLPDTYNGSATDFPKYFYSQTKKEGIIVDGRFNGGGLDPEIFLERLLKKPHGYWTRRYSADQAIPALAVDAYMACLTNRYAGSGGDELPYEFRWHKMGPIIGTRTWGGLVGVSMFIDLIDGGGLTAPDYRIYNEEGKWVVENKGIEPDIVIDVNSEQMAKGYDNQLMKAVEVLMEKIEASPKKMPEHEPYTRQKLNVE